MPRHSERCISIDVGIGNRRGHRLPASLREFEGALIRFLVRLGEGVEAATAILRAVRRLPRCEFWADSVSYVDADLGRVRGHRQVTDAYLASLALGQGGLLATLDEALAADHPDSVALLPGTLTAGR